MEEGTERAQRDKRPGRGGLVHQGPDIRVAFNRIARESAEGDTNSLLPVITACFVTIFTLIKCKSGGLCASVEMSRENS